MTTTSMGHPEAERFHCQYSADGRHTPVNRPESPRVAVCMLCGKPLSEQWPQPGKRCWYAFDVVAEISRLRCELAARSPAPRQTTVPEMWIYDRVNEWFKEQPQRQIAELIRDCMDENPAAPSVEARDADRESIAQTLWIGFGLHVEKLGFHNDPESALRAASLIAQYARSAQPAARCATCGGIEKGLSFCSNPFHLASLISRIASLLPPEKT